MFVNGLRLPAGLVAAIESGKWRPPVDAAVFVNVFGEEPDLPSFYDFEAIKRESRSWPEMPPGEFFLQPSEGNLGLIPEFSIAVADLGPDMPIALDYRVYRDEPRVLYLGGEPTCWKEVAPSVDNLLIRLGLD